MPSATTFLSRPSACQYLAGRVSRFRYEIGPTLTPGEYTTRLQAGWRRFGPVLFRTECPGCRSCLSLRVPTATFRPSATQRRVWKRNDGDITLRIGTPSASPEKRRLFRNFLQFGHHMKGWPPENDPQLELFVLNPFRTEEWTYHCGDRLLGVGYVDALPEGLSAIYFYWDPAEARRSLGTFNVLKIVSEGRQRGLPHVYLGYYVAGYRSLEYKGKFRPNEILNSSGEWEPFIA